MLRISIIVRGNKNKIMKYINGNTFVRLADYIYTPELHNDSDYYKFQSTLNINNLNDGDIVYTHTFNHRELFDILRKSDKCLIVITHNSDHNVSEADYNALPENVVWYSTNINYCGERLFSIPIGIENEQRISFHGINKPLKLSQKVLEPKTYRNLLYICHTTWTNKIERELPYKLLGDKKYVTATPSQIFDFDGYIDNIYNHMFVLCPDGNGVDTHRLWETLYLGSIPIVKRSINTNFYTDLPICFVDSWEEINEAMLDREYDRIISAEWNLEKLTEEYYERNIKKFDE